MKQTQSAPTGENVFEKHDLYDLTDIEMLSRNDDALMGNILGILVSMFASEGDNICRLAAENKWQEVAEVAHKLKTSVTHIRATAVRENVLELEDYANKSDQELKALADRLCRSLAEMKVYLQEDLDKFNAAKSTQ